jgi:hypothetical protein
MRGVMDHSEEETPWPNVLVPFDLQEAISTNTAAEKSGCKIRTIRYWCENDGIGRKVGGRLRISKVALQMKLEGDHEALALYQTGDRKHSRVVTHFKRLGIGGMILKWRDQWGADNKQII